MFNDRFIANFLQCDHEIILKIGQCLTHFLCVEYWRRFTVFAHPVYKIQYTNIPLIHKTRNEQPGHMTLGRQSEMPSIRFNVDIFICHGGTKNCMKAGTLLSRHR